MFQYYHGFQFLNITAFVKNRIFYAVFFDEYAHRSRPVHTGATPTARLRVNIEGVPENFPRISACLFYRRKPKHTAP